MNEQVQPKKSNNVTIVILVISSITILLLGYCIISNIKKNNEKRKEIKIQNAEARKRDIIFENKYNLIRIPAGEFKMGSRFRESVSPSYPRHKVYLDEYYISKYEVTNKKYCDFLNKRGKHKASSTHPCLDLNDRDCLIKKLDDRYIPKLGYDNYPVGEVTWYGAVEYCKWLSEETGLNFRLPTEAEWEKACRGGNDGRWCFGENESLLKDYSWYSANSGRKTHPVGGKKPNAFGLYDMHGNVAEWCSDWWSGSEFMPCIYYIKSPYRNPQGPSSGRLRTFRGGHCCNYAISNSSTIRRSNGPCGTSPYIGFRPVMTLR
ncbi:formylglycine-generating enzyme family protein [Candidatus Dependentiae bacterium]|nr:formylglycine-generating enzyme family protein [Candidatus Dependentiae bacterium]